jgi:hypothetical protein
LVVLAALPLAVLAIEFFDVVVAFGREFVQGFIRGLVRAFENARGH